MDIIAYYQDYYSDKDFINSKFKQFLVDVRSKEIEHAIFLVVRMSRLSRNLEESLTMFNTY